MREICNKNTHKHTTIKLFIKKQILICVGVLQIGNQAQMGYNLSVAFLSVSRTAAKEHQIGKSKVAGLMLVLGVMSLKTLTANFLIKTWCGKLSKMSVLEWHILKKKKQKVNMALPMSPKVGLDSNCPILNILLCYPMT